ncbi:MAG: putative ABC transport system permease protein [Cyclobacteriaceae bacterium]|jgi:putative ABC transport system permease protein
MNLPLLSLKSLISKPLTSILSWLLLTFGVCIVALILLVSDQLKSEINKNAAGINMVVGAKGSPLQIILSSIFHIDFPTGNISLKQADQLSKNRFITSAVPLSLGDSYRGYRIVGTTIAYPQLYQAQLSQGDWFEEDLEAIIGAEVANNLSLKIGEEFASQHGLDEAGDDHGHHDFHVVGIMAPTNTVMDRLIIVSTRSVWLVHEHEEEQHAEEHHVEDSTFYLKRLKLEVTKEELENGAITSLLLTYKSPMAAVMLPRTINAMPDLQAASPAFETARLFNIIGTGVQVLNILGMVVVIISGISIFIALLNSLKERKYEIAIMRSLGASQSAIFIHVILEGFFLSVLGGITGLLVAHIGIGILGDTIDGLNTEVFFFLYEEVYILLGAIGLGFTASILPAIFALKTDISTTLSKG